MAANPSPHSPLPWFDDGYRIYAHTESDDKRAGHMIMEYKHVDNANPADAAFIVRAVNNHEALVEALQAIADVGEDQSQALALAALAATGVSR